jgi:hypothetical protein
VAMTNADLRKAIIDLMNGRMPDGKPARPMDDHWLAERKGDTFVCSWATVSGEIDITHEARDARRLWAWHFRAPSARRETCRTRLAVVCPKRYRLQEDGKVRPRADVTWEMPASNEFAQRRDWQIVDEKNTYDCRAEYYYEGEAIVGGQTHFVTKTVQLV